MAKLTWDGPGDRLFETGLDRGVLYLKNAAGVAWSGLISVTESPVGGDPKAFYMDGIKYQNRAASEEFAGSLEAFTYPPQFGKCDGTLEVQSGLFAAQQRRQPFGLTYRTKIGNDIEGQNLGYKIHLLYNVLASPSERGNRSLQENVEAINFNWGLTTTPVAMQGAKPTSHFIVDSTLTNPEVLVALESVLYGTGGSEPFLPTPEQLVGIFLTGVPEAPFVVTDLGDGIFRISGSDTAVRIVDGNHFELSTKFVIDNQDGSYTATSGDIIGDSDAPFVIETLGGGIFKISGPDSMVCMIDGTHFRLETPLATDNNDGSYTVTSA